MDLYDLTNVELPYFEQNQKCSELYVNQLNMSL